MVADGGDGGVVDDGVVDDGGDNGVVVGGFAASTGTRRNVNASKQESKRRSVQRGVKVVLFASAARNCADYFEKKPTM